MKLTLALRHASDLATTLLDGLPVKFWRHIGVSTSSLSKFTTVPLVSIIVKTFVQTLDIFLNMMLFYIFFLFPVFALA